jgi:5-methylcytosine-specific restriction enzyme B
MSKDDNLQDSGVLPAPAKAFNRADPALAKEIIERLAPNEGIRLALLEIVAATIVEAQRLNPKSWALSLPKSGRHLLLHVGRIFAISIGDGTAAVAISKPSSSQPSIQSDLPSKTLGRFDSIADAVFLEFTQAGLLAQWGALRPLHLAALQLAVGQTRQTPYAWTQSSSALEYVSRMVQRALPTPDYATTPPPSADKFLPLFEEFVGDHLETEEGQRHLARYEREREQGRQNYAAVIAAADRGEDVSNRVLLELMPHSDNEGARRKGAWIHIAPMAVADIRAAFEARGIASPGDWPAITQSVLQFIRTCKEHPEQLPETCHKFSADPHSKGFQAAMLSPMLNALRPDEFIIINMKPRSVINWLADASFSSRIDEYPELNKIGRQIIKDHSQEMQTLAGMSARPTDLFDQFCHWLVAIKEFSFPNGKTQTTRYWKIAPGDNASQWDECREREFIGIGWSALGDLSGLDKKGFQERRDQAKATHDGAKDWTDNAIEQVWKFLQISEGDRIVANRGTTEVVGIGTVVGSYFFVPDVHYGHRIPVKWDDMPSRQIDKPGWRRTLIELNKTEYDEIAGPVPHTPSGLTARSFALLAELAANPTAAFYKDNKGEIVAAIERPVQTILHGAIEKLPVVVKRSLETKKNLFGRILKNDWGRGGAWPWYWGALYPKGGTRIRDAQLFVSVKPPYFEVGFSIGDYASEQRKRFVRNMRKHQDAFIKLLSPNLPKGEMQFGTPPDEAQPPRADEPLTDISKWIADPAGLGIRASYALFPEEATALSEPDLISRVVEVFTGLYPFVLLATKDDPMPAIEEYLEGPPPPEKNPPYPLPDFSEDTGFDEGRLRQWVQAIERKGQAVLYGPPGTGKTFVAERLARHLIGDGYGFTELIQFHPAYAYEDFVQGIRPRTDGDGALTYEMVHGRFLEFCERAAVVTDRCVLIIDEINRANLARVFGELMYLLEYRNKEVPLAGGGTLAIPSNVRLIGTMNTADRSIALVDHALRRRFAFLHLRPDPQALRRYHEKEQTHFRVDGLIDALTLINNQINDPHYEVGISFFMRKDIADQIEDIWCMEIEPYLEEYFFDQAEKVDTLRWKQMRERILR